MSGGRTASLKKARLQWDLIYKAACVLWLNLRAKRTPENSLIKKFKGAAVLLLGVVFFSSLCCRSSASSGTDGLAGSSQSLVADGGSEHANLQQAQRPEIMWGLLELIRRV